MTTEEMNRVIAAYLGWEANNGYGFMTVPDSADPEVYKHKFYYSKEMLFHKSFDWLMPVWQKLRGERHVMKQGVHDRDVSPEKFRDYIAIHKQIEAAILDTDITTAHRLMVEAIELIKK